MLSFNHIFSFFIVVIIAMTTIALIKLFHSEKRQYIDVFGIKFRWRWPSPEFGLSCIILVLSFFLFEGILVLLMRFSGYFLPIILCFFCLLYVLFYFSEKNKVNQS